MTEATAVPVDKLIKAYVALRDKIAQREGEFKASIAEDKGKLAKLGSHLLKILEDSGTDSQKTPYGTALRKVQMRAKLADWDTFFPWAESTDNLHMIKRDIKSTEIAAFLKENGGEIPPGVDVDRAYVINVNRPRGK